MKRLLVLLLCLCMMLPLVALLPLPIAAAEETTAKFTVADKDGNATTTFVYGEPIMVTPLVGEGTDWIGIAPKGRVGYGSVRHKRIEKGSKESSRPASVGLGLNVAFDIRTGAAVESRFAQYADIYPGEWTIFWVANDGQAKTYDTVSAIDITVTEGPMTVNKTEFSYGEPIMVTAAVKENPTYKSWYGIVPDVNGAPKYSYGTIIWRNADGTEDDLRDYSDELSGTVANNTKNWANYFGISQKQLTCLPAGTYWLVYCEDSENVGGGKSVTHKIQIKIKAAFTTNKKSYGYGEAITVKIGAGLEAGDSIFIAPRKADDIEYTTNSIRWQTLTEENISVGSFNIKESATTSNFPDLWDVPPGDYSLFVTYAPNNTAPKKDHGTRVDITVSGDKPDNPVGITYELDDKTTGMAAGKVTVTLADGEADDIYNKPSHVILYWGDESGNKLADYTYIRLYEVTGDTIEIDMPEVTVIPEEAACLMACAYNGMGVSDGLVSVALPADRTKTPEKGELLSSFQIVSDVHAQETQTHKYNQRIAQMLADIKVVDPDSVGIFISGDAVNDGWVEEYENLYALWEESGVTAPIFMATGNHEWKIGDEDNSYTSDYEREKDRFVTYVNKFLTAGGYENEVITDGKPYYDLWVNGFHYIFLASEAPITHAYLSDAQLTWLREKLEEDRDANRPTFIMLHQQMYNAVDGAMPVQDWDGVIAGDANYAAYKERGKWKTNGLYEGPFREILADFPEAMVFSGHSHWDMTDANNIYDPNNPTDINDNPKDASGNLLYSETLPNYLFNTASVAYLVSGVENEAGVSYSAWTSSKGYYVRVYENCIELWGRDFSTAQWVPNAMYRIPLDLATCEHDYDNACDADCNKCGETRTVGAHEGEYVCSDTCKHCDASITPGEHKGVYPCADVCVCGAAITPASQHVSEYACSDVCKYCGEHVVQTNDNPHTYDNLCDTTCNACGDVREVEPHVGLYECSDKCRYCGVTITAQKSHERAKACSGACKYCGEDLLQPAVDHTYSNACDTVCNVCEAERAVAGHQYSGDCDTACNACGATRTALDIHSYDNLCDPDCNVCGEALPVVGHQYSGDCDVSCSECGAIRTVDASHTYDNACDTACNVCGETRTVAGHQYSSDCDVSCNACGATRTAGDSHTYDNACDTACNACGETRTVAGHQYSSDCDVACNECSAIRTVEASHVYDNACDTTCNACDESRTVGAHAGEYECSNVCQHCGTDIQPTKAHESAHGCSNVCLYCQQECITPTAAHAGAAACSDVCAACGVAITPEKGHEGETACTDLCQYCGLAVVVPTEPHAGEYDCSATCAACGIALTEVGDHTWNEGEVTTAPTVEAEGEKTFTCTVCGTTKTENMAKLPAPSEPDNSQGNNNTVNDGSSGGGNAAGSGNGNDAVAEEGLSTGAIVGIVIGVVVLLGIGGFVLYWFVFRKKKGGKKEPKKDKAKSKK